LNRRPAIEIGRFPFLKIYLHLLDHCGQILISCPKIFDLQCLLADGQRLPRKMRGNLRIIYDFLSESSQRIVKEGKLGAFL